MALLLLRSLKACIYDYAINFHRADFPSTLKWETIKFLYILNTITSSLVTLHKSRLCKQRCAAGGPFFFFYGGIKQLWPSCFFTAEEADPEPLCFKAS